MHVFSKTSEVLQKQSCHVIMLVGVEDQCGFQGLQQVCRCLLVVVVPIKMK